MRTSSSKVASRVAIGGVLTALSLVLLYISNLMPSGKIGMVALSGLVPVAGVLSGGFVTGFLCYGATTILGLLILPDKACAIMYAVFLGLYPVVKGLIERLRKLPLEIVLKLAFFNAVLAVLFFGFSTILLPMLPEILNGPLLVFVVGNIVFLVYDYGVSKLIAYFATRIRKGTRR